jgi:hypothetical protein
MTSGIWHLAKVLQKCQAVTFCHGLLKKDFSAARRNDTEPATFLLLGLGGLVLRKKIRLV